MRHHRTITNLAFCFLLIATLLLPLTTFVGGSAKASGSGETASEFGEHLSRGQQLGDVQPQGRATNTPRPTSTPVPIPPPANPISMNFLAAFGILAAVVVFIGLWLHRGRT